MRLLSNRGWTEESKKVISQALDLAQKYLDSVKENAVAGKDRVGEIDLRAAADDAVRRASALLASLKDNVASTAT